MSKVLIIVGICIILIGLFWPLIVKLGLGHWPGDILIRRKNFTFYFPIVTCLILSVIFSLAVWLYQQWK